MARKLLILLVLALGILAGLRTQFRERDAEPAKAPDDKSSSVIQRLGEPTIGEPATVPTATVPTATVQTVTGPTSTPGPLPQNNELPTPPTQPKEVVPERFETSQVRDSILLWSPRENSLTISLFDEGLTPADRQVVIAERSLGKISTALPRIEFVLHLLPGTHKLNAASVESVDVRYLWNPQGESNYRRIRQKVASRGGMTPAFVNLEGTLSSGQVIRGRTAFSAQAPLSADGERAVLLTWDVSFATTLLVEEDPPAVAESAKTESSSGGLFIGENRLSVSSALAFYYRRGASLVIALFDEVLSEEDRKAFKSKGTLLNSVNGKSPSLVFALQLETGGPAFDCGKILGYTVYWTANKAVQGFARQNTFQRSRFDFDDTEWQRCSEQLGDGKVISLSAKGKSLPLRSEQRIRWNFSLREKVEEIR